MGLSPTEHASLIWTHIFAAIWAVPLVTLQNVDRSYWIQKASESVIRMADELLEIINERAEPKQQLTFNKYYIGLSDGTRSKNLSCSGPARSSFVWSFPVDGPKIGLHGSKRLGSTPNKRTTD